MPHYQVIVGNIGTVYDGRNKEAALRHFDTYVEQADEAYGRAAGECVTLMVDEEIVKQHLPENGGQTE